MTDTTADSTTEAVITTETVTTPADDLSTKTLAPNEEEALKKVLEEIRASTKILADRATPPPTQSIESAPVNQSNPGDQVNQGLQEKIDAQGKQIEALQAKIDAAYTNTMTIDNFIPTTPQSSLSYEDTIHRDLEYIKHLTHNRS